MSFWFSYHECTSLLFSSSRVFHFVMQNAHADHDERVRHVRSSWEVHHTVQLSGMCSQFFFLLGFPFFDMQNAHTDHDERARYLRLIWGRCASYADCGRLTLQSLNNCVLQKRNSWIGFFLF
jgi:hypothetical protein